MIAKANGSVGYRYKDKGENKSTFAEMLSPLPFVAGFYHSFDFSAKADLNALFN